LDETNSSHLNLPPLVRFENFVYKFEPKHRLHIGNFTIETSVSNKWGTLTFKFILEVLNRPPFLSEPLEDKLINLGYSGFFRLPQPLDPEDSPVMLYATGKK
jgi:hypothetical protein